MCSITGTYIFSNKPPDTTKLGANMQKALKALQNRGPDDSSLNFVNKIGDIAEEAKALLFALTRKTREQTGSTITTQKSLCKTIKKWSCKLQLTTKVIPSPKKMFC